MSDEKGEGDSEARVSISIPLPEEQVFRYKAADDILELLYRDPHTEFTVTRLRNATGHGGKSVDNAISILSALELIEKRKEGRKSLVEINQGRITKPEDPILEIPQEEFREPVRASLKALETVDVEIVGVLLFGSVARGEADRASDIDLQVIIDGKLTKARRDIGEIRQEVEKQKFNGDRYELQVLVESVKSAESYGEKLREIFNEGIRLRETEKLEEVQEAVFDG